MINRKTLLLTSASVTLLDVSLMLLTHSYIFDRCYENTTCQKVIIDLLMGTIPYTIIFVPFFFFSLVTYKMRDEIFRSWSVFTVWWVPLTILSSIISIGMISDRSGSLGSLMSGWYASIFICVLNILFILISLAIILWKYFRRTL